MKNELHENAPGPTTWDLCRPSSNSSSASSVRLDSQARESKRITRRSSYSDKLKHPEWQKMRLRVMERDKFTCQQCYEKESTLHVHHRYYIGGRMPWEYPHQALVTLCEKCHEAETFDSVDFRNGNEFRTANLFDMVAELGVSAEPWIQALHALIGHHKGVDLFEVVEGMRSLCESDVLLSLAKWNDATQRESYRNGQKHGSASAKGSKRGE